MPLTQQQFAQKCAYVARHASAWAGDTLEMESDVSPDTVARFTDELRERADHIDRRAGRQASAATVPAPVYKAVERILDENSAWIARPSDEVTKRVALAATIAAHTIIDKERAEASPPPGTTAIEALKAAIEGECDGLAIDDAQATTILSYVAQAERAEAEPAAYTSADFREKLAKHGHWTIRAKAGIDYYKTPIYARGLEPDPSPDVEAAPFASLVALRAANVARDAEWAPDVKPDLAFRGNELAGETGEACNVIKKLERERHGWVGSRATLSDLADELADVVICADLAAMTAGIDLSGAVVRKFNATSQKNGLATRMAPKPEAKELRTLLTRVRDSGLIYWEPNTKRGQTIKALMLEEIEKALTSEGGAHA